MMGGFDSCPCCNGSGVECQRITVYERGCGFPHDDVDEFPCGECDGTGTVWYDDEMPNEGEDWTAGVAV